MHAVEVMNLSGLVLEGLHAEVGHPLAHPAEHGVHVFVLGIGVAKGTSKVVALAVGTVLEDVGNFVNWLLRFL